MPPATVQLIYRTTHADGERMVSDHRCGATGYTGSRGAGLALKAAADAAGKPIYLELSSVNPVVITPAALAERGDKLVDEFVGSVLMGAGQFCTNPGLDPAGQRHGQRQVHSGGYRKVRRRDARHAAVAGRHPVARRGD
jgi:2,5-dioxopentanoate dehydrogenase